MLVVESRGQRLQNGLDESRGLFVVGQVDVRDDVGPLAVTLLYANPQRSDKHGVTHHSRGQNAFGSFCVFWVGQTAARTRDTRHESERSGLSR
jgi:hypothetical protein